MAGFVPPYVAGVLVRVLDVGMCLIPFTPQILG